MKFLEKVNVNKVDALLYGMYAIFGLASMASIVYQEAISMAQGFRLDLGFSEGIVESPITFIGLMLSLILSQVLLVKNGFPNQKSYPVLLGGIMILLSLTLQYGFILFLVAPVLYVSLFKQLTNKN